MRKGKGNRGRERGNKKKEGRAKGKEWGCGQLEGDVYLPCTRAKRWCSGVVLVFPEWSLCFGLGLEDTQWWIVLFLGFDWGRIRGTGVVGKCSEMIKWVALLLSGG